MIRDDLTAPIRVELVPSRTTLVGQQETFRPHSTKMKIMPNDQTQYSRIVSCYDVPAMFVGRTIQAFHSEYSVAALQLDDDAVIAFSVEEQSVGKWFEVFPIRLYTLPGEYRLIWKNLADPLTVIRSEVMWRAEWLEPTRDATGLVGSGPHFVQCVSTLRSGPKYRTGVVKVLAGIRLIGSGEQSLVICSSDNTPFKIDLTTDPIEIQQVMELHTCE